MTLNEYAELEGSEVGEYCSLLLELERYRPYMGSDFSVALSAEIAMELKNFEENCSVVGVRVVPDTYLRKELIWK